MTPIPRIAGGKMKIKTISSYLLSILFCLSSLQAKAAQESATLTRTAASGAKLEAQLSSDVYKSVPYQDTYEDQEAYEAEEDYTVDVPYQAEESYYVDIPYQDTETYYENVPYQDTETYYEKIPYTEQESYQDTETYYENEYQCRNRTEYRQECSTERVCSRQPGENKCEMVEECGTNIRGERICKSRKVCNSEPDRENCENKNVCKNVPYDKQECSNVQVPRTRSVTKFRNVTRYREEARTRTVTRYREESRTRTVTKYRQEERTRTVTKYRQETRTRTVTRYRTVTKCCVTRYRDEFDHTWNLNVQVLLPAKTTLFANEKEQFKINLTGSEEKPDVTLEVLSSIYGYKLGRKDIRTGSGVVELLLTPKYNQQTLGEKLLKSVEIMGDDDNSLNEIVINDKGIVPRVNTAYRYRIIEAQSKQAVAEGEFTSETAQGSEVSVKLAEAIPADSDYIIQTSATRSGIVLEKSFSFSVTKEVRFNRWDGSRFDERTIKALSVTEENDNTLLSFVDDGAHAKLTTVYKIAILSKEGKEISSQVLKASDVLDSNKKASIILDASAMALQEDLVVSMMVQRSGKRLEQPVEFSLQTNRTFLSLDDLKDRKKLSDLGLLGKSSSTKLVFQDQIIDSNKVKTEYRLTITRRGGFLNLQKKIMATITFSQEKLARQGLNLSGYLSQLGVSSSSLENYMTSNSTIYLDMKITRKNAVDNKTLASFYKSVELKIQN
jgi:hypothetical protein